MIAIAGSLSGFVVTNMVVGADQELPPAEIEHEGAVDFGRDIMPVLRRNCVACHNATEAESNLNLETPELILKGGNEGPGVIPGKAAESLVFQLAAHQRESFMPPEENDVDAKNLTPDELELLRRWIDEGAKGTAAATTPIDWQTPPGANPIYAVGVSPDGRFVAAGRANQITVYSPGTRGELDRLIDPTLPDDGSDAEPGAAHRDVVQSLAFSPDGRRIASGGFRTAKIWLRHDGVQTDQRFAVDANIDAFAISGDRQRAAILQVDGKLRIFDLVDGTTIRDIEIPPSSISHLALNHDGSWLAAAADRIVRQWNVVNGEQANPIETASKVSALAFLGENHQLVSSGADHLIQLWNSADGSAGGSFAGHAAPVTVLVGVPGQDDQFVSASLDGTANLWAMSSANVVRKFDHAAAIVTLGVSADGRKIATGSETGSTRLWDLNDGKMIAELVSDTGSLDTADDLEQKVALATKHVQNAQIDFDATTKHQQVEEANTVAAEKALADAEVAAKLAAESLEKAAEAEQAAARQAHRDAEKAVTVAGNNAANAREAAARVAADLARLQIVLEQQQQQKKIAEDQRTQSLMSLQSRLAETQTRIAHKAEADRAALEVQARLRAAREEEAGVSESLQSEANAAAQTKSAADTALAEFRDPIQQVSFSRDGSRLAVLSGDRVDCYLTETHASLYSIDIKSSDRSTLLAACFIVKDRFLAVGNDHSLTTWTSHPTWGLERTIGSVESPLALVDRVTAIDFSPDATLVATGGGVPSRSGELKLWKIDTGDLVRTIVDPHTDTVLGAAFSPDGQYLATCGADRLMKVFETESGRMVKSFEGHAHHVLGVGWRADSRLLVTGGADCVVKVWDFQSGNAVRVIEGFKKEVTSIEFLGLSDEFVLTTGDSQVVARNIGGENGLTFVGAADFMYSVRTSDDGQTVAAGGEDGVLRVWDEQGGSLATFAPTTQPQPE